MGIIARVNELQKLQKNLSFRHKELFVLYGRRRLGKTTLLRHACAQKKTLFFSCPIASETESLRLFQAALAKVFSDSSLKQLEFRSWNDALVFAFQASSKHKVPLVFDEFPYLMKSVPGIDAILQHAWDHCESPVWIALCGSLLSIMENEVLGHSAPLYGRRTEQLELAPMSFSAVSQFYKDFSFEQKCEMYAFFGGIPAYASRASQFDSPDQAVLELIFDSNGFLNHEPEFLLREELREPGLYFSVLHALAAGCTKPNEIAQRAGISFNSVGKYLDILRRMRLVEKRAPITEKHAERSTKGIYLIADPFLRFWFRFVFPNRSTIDLGKGAQLWKHLRTDFKSYLGHTYEGIAREFVAENSESVLGWTPRRIGSHWEPGNEIDIVCESLSGDRVAFFECKWSDDVDVKKQIAHLQRKAMHISSYRNFEHEYRIISRTPIKSKDHVFLG
jgi:AAA+ ATPase superfamily predicted ATPase